MAATAKNATQNGVSRPKRWPGWPVSGQDHRMQPEVRAYYDQGQEDARLQHGVGLLELLRTRDLIRRVLPSPPADILDVGGWTGVHARWLAQDGYRVHVVDPVPLHVEQAASLPGVTASTGDARDLDAATAAYDAVLLLGPLYHLTERSDLVQALREAARVVQRGGVVMAAAISRFASLHDGITRGLVADPRFVAMMRRDLIDGQHRNDADVPGWFTTAYLHHPDELLTEIRDAGLDLDRIAGVEGAAWLMPNLDETLDDPARR